MEDNMAVYFIVSFDISDAAGYEEYVRSVIPLLEKHGAETLVADTEAQTLEGEGHDVNVVLKFGSEENAMKWYNSPEYAPMKALRLRTTANVTFVLAEEFSPAV